jgi:phosphoribosylformylglycinamidine synthase I
VKIAIIRFPGSNCDQDALFAIQHVLQLDARYIWYQESSLSDFDAVVLPGGFSFGDYLRGGAIAARSPIIDEVAKFANEGKPVLGICNGFQVLTEAGILPGALVQNSDMRFVSRKVTITSTHSNSFWLVGCQEPLRIPIAHHEGRYVADETTIETLFAEERVAFVYTTPEGEIAEDANPNGSIRNIAGITNSQGNVLGMMPHPERACHPILGSTDGLAILRRLLG